MQDINPPGNARPLHLRHAPRAECGRPHRAAGPMAIAAALTAINQTLTLTLTLLLLTLA